MKHQYPQLAIVKNKSRVLSKDESVTLPIVKLECFARDFERIRKIHLAIEYTLGTLQFVLGILSVVTHAHENDGLLGNSEYVKLEGIVFGTAAQILAGLFIIIPIKTSTAECQKAIEFLGYYSNRQQAVPVRVLRYLASVKTLLFTNPLNSKECQRLIPVE